MDGCDNPLHKSTVVATYNSYIKCVRRLAEPRSLSHYLALSVNARISSEDAHEFVSPGDLTLDYAFRLSDAVHLRGGFRPCDSHIVFLVFRRMPVVAQNISVSSRSQSSNPNFSTACSAKAVALKNGSPPFLQYLQLRVVQPRASNASDISPTTLLCGV